MGEDDALVQALDVIPGVSPHSGGLRPTGEEAGRIRDLLSAHPVFSKSLPNGFVGSKQILTSPEWLCFSLIRYAQKHGSQEAINWLHRLSSFSGNFAIRYIAEVCGVTVKEKIQISNGVTLVPLVQLPASANAEALQRQYNSPWEHNFPTWSACGAYLEDDHFSLSPTSSEPNRSDVLENTIYALTVASNDFAPVVGSSWVDFVDTDLAATDVGRMYRPTFFDGGVSYKHIDINPDAVAWVEKYLQVDEEPRKKLDRAIFRLNISRRRLNPMDQSLDAGICLEILLGDGSENVSYKIRLRTARMLGNTYDDKKAVFSDVKNLYNARSKTAHGGTFLAKNSDDVARGNVICTQLLQHMCEKKFIPNNDDDFLKLDLDDE